MDLSDSDESTWSERVDTLGPPIYRYHFVRFARLHSEWVQAKQDADDATQETLLRLFRYVSHTGLDKSKGSIRMLAFGIAKNVYLETSRSLQKRSLQVGYESVGEEKLGSEPDGTLRLYTLSRLMAHLEGAELEVIQLQLDKDLGLAEIATLLELPIGTVKSHIHRAKQKMKKAYELQSNSENQGHKTAIHKAERREHD